MVFRQSRDLAHSVAATQIPTRQTPQIGGEPPPPSSLLSAMKRLARSAEFPRLFPPRTSVMGSADPQPGLRFLVKLSNGYGRDAVNARTPKSLAYIHIH